MPKLNDMFPSKYLKAADLEDSEMVVTIKTFECEKIGQDKDEKWVVYFRETDKGLVLNKTNSNTIAKLYGDDTDDWEGKQITLFPTEVQFQSDMVEAIRVRSKAPKSAKAERPPSVVKNTPSSADGEDVPF